MAEKADVTKGSGGAIESRHGARREVKEVPLERRRFTTLLQSNPNYFGTFPQLDLEQVSQIAGDTTYEELACVGFHPGLSLLEAVVLVHQSGGYGGQLCSGGSTEYVRFYLSYDGGTTWQDQGVTSFAAHDVPGPKPLEYAVSLAVSPPRKACVTPNLPVARAILSWNIEPPPNTPDFPPVWGNVVDASIQISPAFKLPWWELVDILKISEVKGLEPLFSAAGQLSFEAPKELELAELADLYVGSDVPAHRFVLPTMNKLKFASEAGSLFEVAPSAAFAATLDDLDKPFSPPLPKPIPFPGPDPLGPGGLKKLPPYLEVFPELDIDLSDILDLLSKTDGDTTYEELTCVGLNPNQDMLEAVFAVKKSSGYSGGLCTAGSLEYVVFWVDWGDGAGWTHAGTTSVRAHDIIDLPDGGLHYGVVMPVDLATRRQPCTKGATTARVRAILSWAVEPPSHDPDFVPTWGNREETLVHIKPGDALGGGDLKLYLESVSGVPVCNVNQATGYAPGDKPFGGSIVLTGLIPGAPDVNTPAAQKVKYKVFATPVDSAGNPLPGEQPQPLTNSFGISVIDQTSPSSLPFQHPMTQQIDADGFYTFQEDMNSADGAWRVVQNRVLAAWLTSAPMTGLWRLTVEAKLSGAPVPVGSILCPDGTTRSSVVVRLDEGVPTASLAITHWSNGGGSPTPAQDCDTFVRGQTIHGDYSSFDEHFGSLTLTVEPTGPASEFGPTAVVPSSRSYPIVPTSGESSTWQLDTSNMKACGYIVRLWVHDRTIVNGDGSGWKNATSVGFCLKEPE